MRYSEELGIGDIAKFDIGKLLKDAAFVRGVAEIVTTDKNGKVKQRTVVPNQVTLVGDAHIADQLSDQGEAAMGWMSVGTTSGGKSEASIILEAENTKSALDSGPTQSGGANDHQVVYTCAFTGIAATLVEAGIFNNVAANTGTMLCYTEFSHLMTALDTLTITWTLSVSH